ncbi:hypothetical protein JCM10450v2_005788 [Rhodotorula kratochvilovae]
MQRHNAPTLPLELQLAILELVLPPHTHENLPARRAHLGACSLVHRTWTHTAQRLLFSHFELYFERRTRVHDPERVAFRDRTGFVVKELDLVVDGWDHPDWYSYQVLRVVFEHVEKARLVVCPGYAELPDWLDDDLWACTRLEIVGDRSNSEPAFVGEICLPPTVTSLKLSHLLGTPGLRTSAAPMVRTLYMDGVSLERRSEPPPPFLVHFPNLEVLAWRNSALNPYLDGIEGLAHLQHLYFAHDGHDLGSGEPVHNALLKCGLLETASWALGLTYADPARADSASLVVLQPESMRNNVSVSKYVRKAELSSVTVHFMKEKKEPMPLAEWRRFEGM